MFSSRLLLNLALVIFLTVLVSLAFFNNTQQRPSSAFSQLNQNDINSLIIENNNSSLQIIKSNNNWQITKPIQVEADEFRIKAILSILSESGSTHYDIEEADYKKFNLKPALSKLTINDQEFLFGSTSSVNNKRYVLTNNKLFLIEDTYFPLITSGYKNIMRRQLFASNTTFKDISFDKTHLFKNNKAGWLTDKKSVSADDLNRYITNWHHIQAYAVTKARQPYTGTVVTFQTNDNRTIERIVRKTDLNTVVINPVSGLSYQFDITAFDSLTRPDYFSSDSK